MSTQKDTTKIFPGPGPGPGGPGRHFAGPKVRVKNAKGTVRRLAGYFRGQQKSLNLVFLCVVTSTLLTLSGPYLMGKAIDEYILPGKVGQIWRVLLLMIGVYSGAACIIWLQIWLMIGISQIVVRNIRNELFAKLQTLTLRFFDSRTHGELMSRLTNDVENISNALNSALIQFFSSALSIVGVTVMMFLLNWRLAFVSLIAIPLTAFVVKQIASQTRRGFRNQQKYLGQLNGLIEESITGERVIKSFGQEQKTVEQFAAINASLRKASVHAHTFAGFMGPMMNMTRNINYTIIAGCGGWFAVQGWVTVGVIASFLNYSRQFSRPINQLAQLYNIIQSALAGAERIFEIMDQEPELKDAPNALALTQLQGDVCFDRVSFGYKEDLPVLKNVSFNVEAGQTIALVGPTGAGKTTIINLLTRFYDIHNGSISVDGKDIRTVQIASLRKQLGVVLQDTVLFSGTIRENIRYGHLKASHEEIERAARLANAEQFIHRMSRGYDTELSETGGNLSQGQRQLLAIARAILADPAILILDEATSSVDPRTELHIQDAMRELMKGRTSFVIAHRLSTIREADAIFVIRDGEIVERGTHQELLEKRGAYFELYMSQFGVEDLSA